MITSIVIKDIDLEEHEHLLNVIEKYNSNVELEFEIYKDDVIDMISSYMNTFEEEMPLTDYDCLSPEIVDDELRMNFNNADDEDDSDIRCIKENMYHYFGIKDNEVDVIPLKKLLHVLLLEATSFELIDDKIKFSIYYSNYSNSFIQKFLNKENNKEEERNIYEMYEL